MLATSVCVGARGGSTGPSDSPHRRLNPLLGLLMGPTPQRSDVVSRHVANRGFSLIEMLVALVVLSLSLGVLYQAAAGATRNVRVAAEYTEAVMLAESVLAEYSYITEESYSASGAFGEYDWSVKSWPAADENVPDEMPVLLQPLQYLEVVVSWAGGSESRSVDLLTVVPLRSPPS